MTHPYRKGAPGDARWWALLLALLVCLAPLEGFAAPAKAKPAAAKVKKAKSGKAKAAHAAAKTAKKSTKSLQAAAVKAAAQPIAAAPPLPADPLKLPLKASVAYVVDQDSDEVLFGKNDDAVRPIASITKLMTGTVIADAKLPLDERITITGEDVDRLKFSSSRLKVGTTLTRAEALHLALMSSENRAAHALARTYPGGVSAFVSAMNNKARQLGMAQTRYVDPTGLSSRNQSSARDLALLVDAAYQQPLLRKYSVSRGYEIEVAGGREMQYVNSNRLVRTGAWNIGLQKTGYISEAGRCLVMQAKVKGRNLIMVLLDSATSGSRIRDAEIVKRWLGQQGKLAGGAKPPDA